MAELIYLDFNATTPVDPRVLEQMLPWLTESYWNPASSHRGGRIAAASVESARELVAGLIGADPSEIVWVSGATEANNLALKGVASLATPERRRIVTFATEHKAVLDTVEWLGEQGVPVTVLPVHRNGTIRFDALEETLAGGDVSLVSVMAANNETGVLTDLPSVVVLAHQAGALVHSDATQAVGRVQFDVGESGVDLASMSAHKLYGPKGVGALFVRRGLTAEPLIHGGGHERGLRSGTINVAGVVGFGAAAALAMTELDTEPRRQADLVSRFLHELKRRVSEVELTTDHHRVLPNTLNVRIPGSDAEAVMVNAADVAVSSGSACTARVPSPSHVLRAMGIADVAALESLRVSVGRPTTEDDVIEGARLIAEAAARVRSFA